MGGGELGVVEKLGRIVWSPEDLWCRYVVRVMIISSSIFLISNISYHIPHSPKLPLKIPGFLFGD
jgi:hypothetical protein